MLTSVDTDHAKTQLLEVLQGHVTKVYGKGATVKELNRLSGGASRETWSLDVFTKGGTCIPLILKRDPVIYEPDGSFTSDESYQVGVSRTTEGKIIEQAALSGVPVPEVAFFLDDARSTDGFVMQRLEGEALGLRIAREDTYADARINLAFQCGQAAAKLHNIPLVNLPELESRDVTEALAYNHEMMSSTRHPYPGFEYGFRWLEERVELAGDQHTLVHGDFRNGNIVVDTDGLRGVLDWEVAHVGNPLSDLGWICVRSWRYGFLKKPVGGFGEISELLAGYEAGGGKPVSKTALHFWEVFGTLRWGMLCINLGFQHLNGPHSSLEQAAIGRRTAETEYDLLQLID
ncbi:MAG: phosphotransferase family protein [Gammaproteobacteria bacterium]|jgi:aminoglycoside phosphotransferase (APT) family kinase protein|nr:phosphotransferase family protein [Gammaproteobacteria bacterium]